MLYQLFFSTTINWGECQRTSIQILNKNQTNQIKTKYYITSKDPAFKMTLK